MGYSPERVEQMPALLDLVWKYSAAHPTPPDGQAPAIYRGDTYTRPLQWWTDSTNTTPLPLDVGATYAAQIRENRLTAGATAGTPLASFALSVDQPNGLIIMTLTPTQTLALPSVGFWDIQENLGGVITTLIAGKVKVLDDVTR